MKRYIPLFILLVIAFAAGVFLITTRMVGRQLMKGVSEPAAFEGPELIGGYILYRGLRGPESYIEDAGGRVVIPDVAHGDVTSRWGVARLALAGQLILGEVADLDSDEGTSRGYFLIDTATGAVIQSLPEPQWRERVRAALGAEPPDLTPADSYPPEEPAR